jgi:hypothetical protein
MAEAQPGHEAWTDRRIARHSVSLSLGRQSLVRVAEADTAAGRLRGQLAARVLPLGGLL